MSVSNRRFLAEWESCEYILMALPEHDTDWNYMLSDARNQYKQLIRAFTKAGETVILLCHNKKEAENLLDEINKDNLIIIEAEYNDTWTRDYGPLAVIRDDRLRALDFGFNGWGLKFASDKDNLVNLSLNKKFIIEPTVYRNERDYELEGGSIDTDGEGTLLTTTKCLCSPNRNGGLTRGEVNRVLEERLGVEHVLWLDYGSLAGDDTDSHIDTLARICPNNTIVFTGCKDESDEHFEDLLKMRAQLTMFRNAEGEPFNLIELPLPNAIFDENGERLPATYANYLVTPRNIFIPGYGQPDKDKLAIDTLRVIYPEQTPIQIDCRQLIRQHGSLHCATMQIPGGLFNSTLKL